MGNNTFENYGILALQDLSNTEASGRYLSQQEAEKRILLDVVQKLSVSPSDHLLDIGCGSGLLLLPLSFLVQEAHGIDHPSVIARLSSQAKSINIKLKSGSFLDIELGAILFDKILIYGVIQCLPSEQELFCFIHKALQYLAAGGKMLIGDIPNVDKKRRFLDSPHGAAFESAWISSGRSFSSVDTAELLPDDNWICFDDPLVLRLIAYLRNQGVNAYILPQAPELPFGHTREDILVVKPC